MLKTRDIEKLESVSLESQKVNSSLKENEMNLINKIQGIRDFYQGVESEKIIEKFVNAAKELDTITNNLNYYGDYLSKLSSSDRYNIESSYKKMQDINNEGII